MQKQGAIKENEGADELLFRVLDQKLTAYLDRLYIAVAFCSEEEVL